MTDPNENQNERWAVVELMGHTRTAGLIRTSDLGGLLRVDVPLDDGFHTHYYGEGAIYGIHIVSEEIARASVLADREISPYDEPIVPRAEYEKALARQRDVVRQQEHTIEVLQERLTRVTSLPAHEADEDWPPSGEEEMHSDGSEKEEMRFGSRDGDEY